MLNTDRDMQCVNVKLYPFGDRRCRLSEDGVAGYARSQWALDLPDGPYYRTSGACDASGKLYDLVADVAECSSAAEHHGIEDRTTWSGPDPRPSKRKYKTVAYDGYDYTPPVNHFGTIMKPGFARLRWPASWSTTRPTGCFVEGNAMYYNPGTGLPANAPLPSGIERVCSPKQSFASSGGSCPTGYVHNATDSSCTAECTRRALMIEHVLRSMQYEGGINSHTPSLTIPKNWPKQLREAWEDEAMLIDQKLEDSLHQKVKLPRSAMACGKVRPSSHAFHIPRHAPLTRTPLAPSPNSSSLSPPLLGRPTRRHAPRWSS